jgi:hypothetical protein
MKFPRQFFSFVRLRVPAILLSAVSLTFGAIECQGGENKVPARIELADQHNKEHVISFPARQVTVICLADRQGREQSNQWAPTLAAFRKRAAIHGIANAAGTPGFMKESVRRKIQAGQKQDLLIDWTGATCTAIGCQAGVANLVIVSRNGTILHRLTGAPTPQNVKAFTSAFTQALAKSK